MRTRLIASLTAICLALLLFSACGLFQEETPLPEYTLPPFAEKGNETDNFDGVIPNEPETEGTKLNSNEIQSLSMMLFGNRYGDNWYYRSVPVLWNTESPADIDLYMLFYNGFIGECDNLSYEEMEFLSLQTGLEVEEIMEMGQFRLPEFKMDRVLQEYYGVSLMETNLIGLQNCYYWSATNCYYVLRNGTAAIYIGIHSAYEQADGGFIIYYSENEKNPAPKYVMELVPNEFGGYTIIGNKPVM